jgi:signal transduction histidine kinase
MKRMKALTKQFLWPEGRRQFWLAGVLIVFFPLLAALQYRWLGQLSESEQKQMRAGLQAAATRFGDEFDQEITIALAAFLPDFDGLQLPPAQRLAQAYQQWHIATRYPNLIGEIYFITSGKLGLQLSRLEPATQQLEPGNWPPGLEAVMRQQFEPWLTPPAQLGNDRPFPFRPGPQLFEPNLPALMIPQPGQGRPFGFEPRPTVPQINVAVVRLNQEYLQRELLPSLARKHFGGGQELDYELVVHQGSQTPTNLSPAPANAPPLTAANADLSLKFFRVQPEEFRERFRRRMSSQMSSQMSSLSPQNFPAMPPPRPSSALPNAPPNMPPVMMPPIGFMSETNEAGLWQLHIRHQAGSLTAAVTQARRRNLLVSSSILLLLAGSVFLLIRSARRARQLAQQQMEFVAGVSHELRTPLTVIESAAYNLAKGVTRTPEQMQQYGKVIRKQTRQLHEMIEQMLEFAGIQSGRPSFTLQAVEPNVLLAEFIQSNESLLAERGFHWQPDIAHGLPQVQADAGALRRALQNLLNNALKYSGESRWIGLRAAVDAATQPATVVIEISDLGIGIAAQELPHVCEPFYRGSEVRAAQIHGNGLGLSLVQNIVKAHGGKLEIESEVGNGSTFRIRLSLTNLTADEKTQTQRMPAKALAEAESQ